MKWLCCFVFIAGSLLVTTTGCKYAGFAFWQQEPDSLYIGKKYSIRLPYKFPAITNHYADSLTYEGIELGRRLFYDKHLSKDGKKSCASCHFLQYAFTDSGKARSINEGGLTLRNAQPLQNLLWAKQLFWDGKITGLDAQAKDAAHNELAIVTDITISYLKADTLYPSLFKKAFGRTADITEYEIDKALQQFLISIISADSKYDKVQRGEIAFTPAEQRGFNIFSTDTGGCFRCHNSEGGKTLLMTDNLFKNNGLDTASSIYQYPDSGRGAITHKASDFGLFKVPTLRNIAITGPYMHDGRYKTLQQVIDFYSDSTHLSVNVDPVIIYIFRNKNSHSFTATQKRDLLSFLSTLTDSVFLHNPAYSDPFK